MLGWKILLGVCLVGCAYAAGVLMRPVELNLRLGQSQSGRFDLRNNGNSALKFALSSNAAWLRVSPHQLNLAPGAVQTVEWSAACQQTGFQQAVLLAQESGNSPEVWLQVRLSCQDSIRANEMLNAVNQARALGRSCGGRTYAPAPPLSWDVRLEQAALRHAQDLLRQNQSRSLGSIELSHSGSDGSQVKDRVSQSGYRWSSVGENVGWGHPVLPLPQAIEGWLQSPGHCANLMNPGFNQLGMAMVSGPSGDFWVQVFAKP